MNEKNDKEEKGIERVQLKILKKNGNPLAHEEVAAAAAAEVGGLEGGATG